MVAKGRRQFLSALGAMLVSDVAYDPEVDETRNREAFVARGAVQYLSGLIGDWIPVWLHEDRITVNRIRQRDGLENDPGIAVLTQQSLTLEVEPPPSWQVQLDGVYVLNSIAAAVKPGSEIIRVIDAHDGRVLFTSKVPDRFLRSSEPESYPSPLVLNTMINIQCRNRRIFSRLFSANGAAPYEPYFDDQPLAVLQAVPYRNYLRESPSYARLVRTLNPDFYEWFWRRVAQLPELPHPLGMCHEEGELWSTLAETYI